MMYQRFRYKPTIHSQTVMYVIKIVEIGTRVPELQLFCHILSGTSQTCNKQYILVKEAVYGQSQMACHLPCLLTPWEFILLKLML